MPKEKTPKITPRSKFIFVKPDEKKAFESKYGVVIPNKVKDEEGEEKSVGEVLAVGSEIKDIKKGDRVIYGTFAGDKIEFQKVEYVLLHDDEVLAFLKD